MCPCRVGPKARLGNPQSLGLVLAEAHRAGFKVYPVVCVATPGGEGKANALLERNPSRAQVTTKRGCCGAAVRAIAWPAATWVREKFVSVLSVLSC